MKSLASIRNYVEETCGKLSRTNIGLLLTLTELIVQLAQENRKLKARVEKLEK